MQAKSGYKTRKVSNVNRYLVSPRLRALEKRKLAAGKVAE